MVAAQPDLTWVNTAIDEVAAAASAQHFWYGIGVGVVFVLIVLAFIVNRRYRAKSMTVSMPFGLGSIVYESSTEDRVLAWKMYVQLSTRKAALLFDDSDDVIAEVYSSLYELFSVTRELLSETPLADVERPKGVADLILRTLNDGLRPHLTRWNSSYRRWWDQQLSSGENGGKTPQEIQKGYPQFKELVEDLKRTNTELARFADELLAIARADRPKPLKVRTFPKPPTDARIQDIAAEPQAIEERSADLPTTPYVPAANAEKPKQ